MAVSGILCVHYNQPGRCSTCRWMIKPVFFMDTAGVVGKDGELLRGFTETGADKLPKARQGLYNYQRRSKFFSKPL